MSRAAIYVVRGPSTIDKECHKQKLSSVQKKVALIITWVYRTVSIDASTSVGLDENARPMGLVSKHQVLAMKNGTSRKTSMRDVEIGWQQ